MKEFLRTLVLGVMLLTNSTVNAETKLTSQKQEELIKTYFSIALTAFEHKQISYGCENLLEINSYPAASKSDLAKVKKYTKKYKCKNLNKENLIEELNELAKLYEEGAITKEEFSQLKAKVLGQKEVRQTQEIVEKKDDKIKILNPGGKKTSIVNKIAESQKECEVKKHGWNINYCISIEELLEAGTYKQVKNFPEGMIKEFGNACKSESCRLKKASAKMYEIFVRRSPVYHARKPGEMIKGMAWYELVYLAKLKKNRKTINTYLKYGRDNYPDNLKIFRSNHEKSLASLISMNKGRKNMREAMGMSINDDIETVMKKHWALGEFLNNDKIKAKKTKMDPDIKKRKILLEKYQATLGKYKKKIDEEKEKKQQ